MSATTELSWPMLVLAILPCLTLAGIGGTPWRLSRPSTLVGLMGLVMVVCGSWSYYATREFFPSYYAPINTALGYAALGLTITTLGAWLMRRAPRRRAESGLTWDRDVLDRLVLAYLVLAIIGTVGSLIRIGYIPILRGDIREERLLYAGQAGVFFRLSLLGASAAVLGGVRWMLRGRSALALIAVPACLVSTALYGPRFFPFVVVGILFICYDAYVRRVRVLRAILGITVLAAIGMAAALNRESSGTFVFQKAVGRIDAKTALNAVGYMSVPEFRDFAWSLDYFNEERHRLGGETILGASTALLPAPVWQLMGIDKNALYSRDSGTIMAEVLGQDTGIRVGILGELFMNFGLPGIIVGMVVFGLLVGWLDRRVADSCLEDPTVPLIALLVIVTTFALLGELHMFVSAVVLFGWPFVLATLLAGRRGRASTTVAANDLSDALT